MNSTGATMNQPTTQPRTRRRNIGKDLLILVAIVAAAFAAVAGYDHWYREQYMHRTRQSLSTGVLEHWADAVRHAAKKEGKLPATLTGPEVGAPGTELRGVYVQVQDAVYDLGNGNIALLASPAQSDTGWGACLFRLERHESRLVWFDDRMLPQVASPEEALAALRRMLDAEAAAGGAP